MDHRAMLRVASDPAQVKGWAAQIRARLGQELNDRDHAFLDKLAVFDGAEPLSVRQREYLSGLIERTERYTRAGGYRASDLIHRLHEARVDLHEDEEAAVSELPERGPGIALSRTEWRLVLALSRRLGLIEDHYVPLPGPGRNG